MKRSIVPDGILLEKMVFQIRNYFTSESGVHTFVLAVGVFSLMSIYTLQRSYNPFVHDSAYYWSISNSFIEYGQFSLTNFANELRGYLFPFLLFILRTLAGFVQANEKTIFYLFSSLLFTALSVYILPWFARTLFGWKNFLFGRALIALLMFFFWRGYFLYPLSDFLALVSLLIGVAFFAKSLRNPAKVFYSALAGFFLSAALNIRPVYLISLSVLLTTALLFLWRIERNRLLQWLLIFAFGCSIILFPQYQINRKHFQVSSPWVQARYGGDESLFVKQLFWGLGTQKFESNIGENYPSGPVVYEDPFILNLQKTNLLKEKTIRRYLEIVRRYPLDISVSYFRHMFNGLDIFFPTPYVKNVFAKHFLLSVVNYLIWLFVIFRLLKTDLSQPDYISAAGVIGLLFPTILAIPTAVEVRFFLPAHALAYGVIAFGINLTNFAKPLLQNKWNLIRFIILIIFWVMLCFTLSTATIENLV